MHGALRLRYASFRLVSASQGFIYLVNGRGEGLARPGASCYIPSPVLIHDLG